MEVTDMCQAAVNAIINGTDLILHLPAGEQWPLGWPRGELLSKTEKGENRSFDPLKVLGHVQRLAKLANGSQSTMPSS